MDNLKFENILGWKVPEGSLPCWVISESERLFSIKEKKPFYDYSPCCYFKITQRLDNNFIEGHLGHSEYKGKRFHDDISTSYEYFSNYQKREPVYFSFDRVSLYRLIEIIPNKPLSFILKRVDSPKAIKPNRAFMIMPFKIENLDNFYQSYIKNYLKTEFNIDIYRADDFNDNDIIIETIYNQIEQSEFIIVETSHPNKNVFFEFGYAVAKDKEIITIQNTEIEKNLFFDRAHIRAIFYSFDNIDPFQKQLEHY
ncbi:MAG: hypothetical protein GX259_07820 [Bacteroidales bacterium]|nr:hypothetical protein [Bacteroidales bacterium]